MSVISTPITEMFGIKHPILLAGMNVAAGPELAAAVTNAGGLGVIGGHGYTPKVLRAQIQAIKKDLKDKNAPFGVDLLIPQVGGNARKTNYDYNKGNLGTLVDIIIDEKAALFVCAVGVPPKEEVAKLHKAGIPVMNMAGEGGGHTGDISASILIPACVDAVKGHKSPLTGGPVYVVGAGAVYDGRGLAANLMYGAQAVWVGTRFVASTEAGASPAHKKAVLSAGHGDVLRTVIYTGRPLRVRKTPYVEDWETNRQAEIAELTAKGIIPNEHELKEHPEKYPKAIAFLMGNVAAVINDVLPAQQIVDNMVAEAKQQLERGHSFLGAKAKL